MIVQLGTSVTVRTVESVRVSLLEALDAGAKIEIDASAVLEMDLSLLQVLHSMRVRAAQQDKLIRLSAPANPVLVALLDRAGFLTDPTPEDIDFWCHGERPQ